MTTGQQIAKNLGGFTRNLPHKYKPVLVLPSLLMIYLTRHWHWGCGKALRRQITNSSSFAGSLFILMHTWSSCIGIIACNHAQLPRIITALCVGQRASQNWMLLLGAWHKHISLPTQCTDAQHPLCIGVIRPFTQYYRPVNSSSLPNGREATPHPGWFVTCNLIRQPPPPHLFRHKAYLGTRGVCIVLVLLYRNFSIFSFLK